MDNVHLVTADEYHAALDRLLDRQRETDDLNLFRAFIRRLDVPVSPVPAPSDLSSFAGGAVGEEVEGEL